MSDQEKRKSVITVACGEVQGEGHLAGLAITQVKAMIAEKAPQFNLPEGAIATITTMNVEDEAWKQVEAEQQMGMVMHKTERGVQIMQGASKDVPETYVVRDDDIFLSFRAP